MTLAVFCVLSNVVVAYRDICVDARVGQFSYHPYHNQTCMCPALTTLNVPTHSMHAMENGKYHSTVKQAYLKNVKPECAVQYLDSVL